MKKFNFHIKPIGLLDMLHFKTIVPKRRKKLESGSTDDFSTNYSVNQLAKSLHPFEQEVIISDIVEHKDAKTFTFKADKLAMFRAGQYVSIILNIGQSYITRPYSLCSSPEMAKNGLYEITVKKANNSFVSDFVLKNGQVGDKVTLSGPEGNFYFEPVRDEQNVIAIAGGSGITPFLSMAKAILDEKENFNLTILYGSRTKEDILFKDEFEKITKATDKVKVVYVLSDDKEEGYENGFISAELIKKYAKDKYSIFICGPKAMYDFVLKELEKLKLDKKHIRQEMVTPPSSPKSYKEYKGDEKAIYNLTVNTYGEKQVIPMRGDEPVLVAIERAGIKAPSRCRSGECGCCRSKLISGKIFIPEQNDERRFSDIETGYFYPCNSWAVSDLEIEIYPK